MAGGKNNVTLGDITNHLANQQCIKYTGVACAEAFTSVSTPPSAPPVPEQEGPTLLQRAGRALEEVGNVVTGAINEATDSMKNPREDYQRHFDNRNMPKP